MEGRREVIHRLLKNKTKNQMEIRIWPMKIPEKKKQKTEDPHVPHPVEIC